MRLALAVVLGIALAVGAALWSTAGRRAPDPAAGVPPASAPARASPLPEAAAAELELLRAEVSMLADRMADLEAELELLRSALERRPAGEAPPAAAAGAPERGVDGAAALAALREAREAQAARRAAERQAREERLVLERARRIAAEVELDPAAEAQLAECLRAEALELRALLERWSAADADRELLAGEFLALREAAEQRLRAAFGPELAAEILRSERASRGRLPDPSGRPPGAPEDGE